MAKVLVLYHSQEFGNTAVMAEAVAQGIRESGYEVDLFNTNNGRFDVTFFPQYDGVAFGSPDYYSYVAGTLKTFMDDHYIAEVHKEVKGLRDKPYVLFCSHGGGGKVRTVMINLFTRIGTLVGTPVDCMSKPDRKTLEKCLELGKQLAEAINKR